MSDEDTYLRQIEPAKTDADTWPQWMKDAARIGEAVSDTQKMVEVTAADANNYCRVLSALGMEEEGDPVQEITSIKDQLAATRAELARAMRVVEAAAWMRSAYKLNDDVAEEAETRLWSAITEWEAGR